MLVSSSDDDVLAGWRHFSPLWNPSEHEETRFFFLHINFYLFWIFFRHILHLETRSFLFLSFEEFFLSPLGFNPLFHKSTPENHWLLLLHVMNQISMKKRRKNPSRPPCLLVKHPFSSKLKIKSENNNFDKLPTLNNFLDLNSSDDLATQYSIKEENWKWSIKFLNIKN